MGEESIKDHTTELPPQAGLPWTKQEGKTLGPSLKEERNCRLQRPGIWIAWLKEPSSLTVYFPISLLFFKLFEESFPISLLTQPGLLSLPIFSKLQLTFCSIFSNPQLLFWPGNSEVISQELHEEDLTPDLWAAPAFFNPWTLIIRSSWGLCSWTPLPGNSSLPQLWADSTKPTNHGQQAQSRLWKPC